MSRPLEGSFSPTSPPAHSAVKRARRTESYSPMISMPDGSITAKEESTKKPTWASLLSSISSRKYLPFADTWKYQHDSFSADVQKLCGDASAHELSSLPLDVNCKNPSLPPQQLQYFQVVWIIFISGAGAENGVLQKAQKSDLNEWMKQRGTVKGIPPPKASPAVFMRGSHSRQVIADTLSALCAENPKLQTNLLQLIKMLITSLLAETNGQFRAAVYSLCNIFDVCIRLLPNIFDFGSFLDLITEFSKPLPIMSLPVLVKFLDKKQNLILQEYHRLEHSAKGDKKRMQTIGAKFVGLVKALEERLNTTSEMRHIFTLRRLLIQCLPLTHAGVTNKMSIHRAEVVEYSLDSKAVWQELAIWEASSMDSSPPSSSLLGKPPQSLRSFDMGCPYTVYEAYGSLQAFLQHPALVIERGMEFLKQVYDACCIILRYFSKKKANFNISSDFVSERASATDISSAAAFREAIDESFFRKEFLMRLCLAFQTMMLPHKKEIGESVALISLFDKLEEKGKRLLGELSSQVWKAVQMYGGFEEDLQQLLIKENLWILWKQLGCSDTVLISHHKDQIKAVELDSEEISQSLKNVLLLEGADSSAEIKEYAEAQKFLKFFSEWEKTMNGERNEGMDAPSSSPLVESPQLLREAVEWYISKRTPVSSSYDLDILANKFSHKLKEYRLKIKDDDDVVNEIEEAEKSKYNSLFRFRLSRLFAMDYLDTYIEMSHADTIDGKTDALVRAMDAYDSGNLRPASMPKMKSASKRKFDPTASPAINKEESTVIEDEDASSDRLVKRHNASSPSSHLGDFTSVSGNDAVDDAFHQEDGISSNLTARAEIEKEGIETLGKSFVTPSHDDSPVVTNNDKMGNRIEIVDIDM